MPARSADTPGDITRLLDAWSQGDSDARDRLMPVVYGELRRRATAYLRREPRGLTLRPTDLVHETYLRLCEQNAGWKNRDHFLGVAAKLMRRILVDRARAGRRSGAAACASLYRRTCLRPRSRKSMSSRWTARSKT